MELLKIAYFSLYKIKNSKNHYLFSEIEIMEKPRNNILFVFNNLRKKLLSNE